MLMRRPPVASWQLTLASFLVLVGFLVVLQLRAGRSIRREVELPTLRVRELAVLVRQQEEALAALQAEIADLRRKMSEYETAAAHGRSSAETLAREVESYRMVLGLIPVEGPGVTVRVSERPLPGVVAAPPVQAADLSGLVNELWSSGAEAVAVNGMRILATTGIRQTDDTLWAGIFRLDPPYEIQAVGDPKVMLAALNLRGGFVEGLRSVGLLVEIEESPRLRLPAYQGPLRFRYGRPSS
jgi:uncharacterized protein YlxW (UPF0749 family)